jgi:peptidoglycan/LPS O-acetylase OafA/YrhL
VSSVDGARGHPRAPSSDRTFRPDIQGLRAIAVLLVVAYHAGLPLSGGYVGVDVFFVISGFLITGHLVAEVRATQRLDFGRFYARRARRILPASFVVLFATLIGSVFILPPGLIRSTMQDAVATALYVPNLLFAWRGTDYLAETAPSPFQHYWSLGVEEQFYLIWPLALFLLWRFVRRDPRRLGIATLVLVLGSFTIGLWLTGTAGSWAFFSLPSRAWQLGVGALLAILGPALMRRIPPHLGAASGWVGVGCVLFGAVVYDSSTPFPGIAALLPVAGAAAIIASGEAAARWGPSVLLGTRPFQFVGAISYSLYLVHWPLVVLPTYLTGTMVELPLVATVGLSLLGVPLAWLLYRWVETPVRRSRSLGIRRPRFTLLVALAASVATVLVALTAIVVVDNRPTSAGHPATETVVTMPPDFTDFVPSNLTPSLQDAAADLPVIYADGCHLPFEDSTVQSCIFGVTDSTIDVVLFGDSHAAQWFPALDRLAKQEGFRLHSFTKSSCPSVDVPILVNNAPYLSCDEWRSGVIERINELHPDLIVMSNLARYPDQGEDGIKDEEWAAGLERVINQLPSDASVALIADTPSFTQTPSVCLSANLNDPDPCGRSRVEALDGARDAAERAVAEKVAAARVDFSDVLCDQEFCGTIIGSTLVYRDTHHLTATFAGLLADPLWAILSPLIGPD